MPTDLLIELIRTDGGTQMRAEIHQDVYLDYRDKMLAGVEFDPIDVFHDGTAYWLADGFHRFYGAREGKRKTIPCNVRRGTQRDAILFATGANAAHGLRRSNEDKRRAVEALLNDAEWVKWSDGKIAEQAAVSQNFVSDVRRQLKSDLSSPAAQSNGQPREGRDGKLRKPPRKPVVRRPPGDEDDPFGDSDPFGEGEGEDGGTDADGTDSEEEQPARPPRNGREAPAGQRTAAEEFRLQKSKTIKTAEALMRAVDDLNDLRNFPEHGAMHKAIGKMIETVKAVN